MRGKAFLRMTLTAAGLAAAVPALADSIDGNWCNAAGTRQMQISGTTIVTPGGKKIEGRYARHSFTYTAPDGDPAAGAMMQLQLLNENLIRSSGGDLPVDSWHRCEQTS
ncbi:hypothetical protein [Alsobacter sp. R-9]